jgi:Mlc titration factor MtfA (ptsG expression regulator)
LSLEHKNKFKKRVQKFIHSKDFEGRKELIVTDEMKVLVAAIALQLTFGFKKHYNYDYFYKIILYPERYLSRHTGLMHTGEMNTSGILVFSWKDFYEGIKTDNDSKNVGLHEFAHALDFMAKAQLGVDDYFYYTIEKIKVFARHYIQKQPEQPFFRNYATTNSMEFFAVATEYFFEAPAEFRKAMPELYNLYTIALRQSPLSTVKISINNRLHISKKNKYSEFQINTLRVLLFAIVLNVLYVFIMPILLSYHSDVETFAITIYFILNYFILYLLYTNAFKNQVEFNDNKVYIYYSFIKLFFNRKNLVNDTYYAEIPIEDVLLIYKEDFEQTVPYSKITTTYLKNGEIKHITCIASELVNYIKIFRFYFNEHKIAIYNNGFMKTIK